MKKICTFFFIVILISACVPTAKNVKDQGSEKTKNESQLAQLDKKNEQNSKWNPSVKNEASLTEKKGLHDRVPSEKPKKQDHSGQKNDKNLTDEQKVKNAAVELIKGMESPKKYLICHDEIQDEWSLTVFDDIGHVLDVKQFFWNAESDKMEPFLVLTRIPKGRLKYELSRRSTGKNCSSYDP